MLRELIDRTTRGARTAAVIGVALAVGVVVGVSALDPAADVVRTVAAGGSSASSDQASHGRGLAHDKADQAKAGNKDRADDKAGDKADEHGDEGGEHGRCVSAVARDKAAVGGPHDNHGWAVSRAAHTCPHPTPKPSGGS